MYDFGAVYEAYSVSEAVHLKMEHPEARFIAGGSDLLVQMRAGLHAGSEIISLYLIDEMRKVSMTEDGALRIGALASFSHITKNELVLKYVPVLAEAVDKVGGPQVRNIGTIGGNVCNAHTGADSGATLWAWDALAEVTGPDGVRMTTIQEFYRSDGRGVNLDRGELLTALIISRNSYSGYFGSHWKYAVRNAMDVDVMGCSTNLRLSDDKKRIETMRMAFAIMGATPLRALEAEKAAQGMEFTQENIHILSDLALEGLSPRTDMRGTRELRMHTAHVAARRTMIDSIIRAGGDLQSETLPWAQGPFI